MASQCCHKEGESGSLGQLNVLSILHRPVEQLQGETDVVSSGAALS